MNFEKNKIDKFPISRYMGSKRMILDFIFDIVKNYEFNTVLDAFSGSASVSYLLKTMGKSVTTNDFLTFNYHIANGLVANNNDKVNDSTIQKILSNHSNPSNFIFEKFQGLYFEDYDLEFLENSTAHIREISNKYTQSLAYSSLVWACLRKRPRGIFTYTGSRYNDGRRHISMSLKELFIEAVENHNNAVFDNHQLNYAYNDDIFNFEHNIFDLVYIDTPYVSPYSDNDYTRRYHFVEGLTRYWKDLEIQENTVTKKFKRIPSLFDNPKTVHEGFNRLIEKFRDNILVISYSSNGIPDKEEMVEILCKYKNNVQVFERNHLYSFANQKTNKKNQVIEYLFVGS